MNLEDALFDPVLHFDSWANVDVTYDRCHFWGIENVYVHEIPPVAK